MSKKVQVAFPRVQTNLTGWTLDKVLSVTGITGRRWNDPIDDDADLAIFIADAPGGGQINLDPIRRAIRAGVNVFIVTGGELTVSPTDLGEISGEGRVWFFHSGKSTAEEGFIPFRFLGEAIERLFDGLSLADLGKEE